MQRKDVHKSINVSSNKMLVYTLKLWMGRDTTFEGFNEDEFM